MSTDLVYFNRPFMTGKELFYIAEAKFGNKLAGDGPFTSKCHTWLEKNTTCNKALLTHSCTAALEMSAMLLNIEPGDEIIMPSYTFVSTANAFVLRGGKPVFIDIRPDTLNLDEKLIEEAITEKTKAIVPVHYAGVGCEMDKIMAIAKKYNLAVVEDAAQGIMAKYKEKPLGSIGDLGTLSFHETKNVISGEGGALLINDHKFTERAEIIREKGTNRSKFHRGQVDKYTWQDIGSSFLPGELIAAFLWAQLEEAQQITSTRISAWQLYDNQLADLENQGKIRRPYIPKHCEHNAHMYYLILNKDTCRDTVLSYLNKLELQSVFHYVPLHSSPAGKKYCRAQGDLINTNDISERLIRLPLWVGITEEIQERVITALTKAISIASKSLSSAC